MRSSGSLARILSEMRSGHISEEMWTLLKSRELQPHDQRLSQPPFSDNPNYYIVHRHAIRVKQAFCNAVAECQRRGQTLYAITACDEVADDDEAAFTEDMREELLKTTNPRETKSLQSILFLYHGMRVILNSKECVRLGLMNGCECVLEQIVFADQEHFPVSNVAGQPVFLRCMPTTLMLRVPDATWDLTRRPELCSALPAGIAGQGLFQLPPTTAYLRHRVEKEKYVQVRRTQFSVLPADTRIVYAAQGDKFKACMLDMWRPPRMSLDTFWLACYVMLSRATSLDGLLIMRLAKYEELSRPAPQFILDEIDRLLELEAQSTTALLKELTALDSTGLQLISKMDFDSILSLCKDLQCHVGCMPFCSVVVLL